MKRIVATLAVSFLAGAAAAEPVDTAPRVYALVSAIGSSMQYVKPRFSTGTHLPEYQRADMQVPDATLDMAALRGIESVIKGNDPSAKVEYLRLNPAELKDVEAPRKGTVAVGKVAAALQKFPGRDKWHQVVIVAPRYVANEREGMGAKLSGIGIYVQNLEKGVADGSGTIGNHNDQYETMTPEGEKVTRSGVAYVAPYFYVQVWVLDGQTLETLQVTERFDLVRYTDPKSSAIKIEQAIPPEKLGPLVETFVEKTAQKAAREAIGVVTVGEPKVVKPN